MTTAQDIASNDFINLHPGDPVSKLIGRLEETAQPAPDACVVNGKEFVGLCSPKELLKVRVDIAQLKVSTLAIPAPRISPDDDLLAIASYMYDANASMLPVIKNGKLSGVVYALEALAALRQLPAIAGLRVRDIRHPVPITVREDDRIDTALNIMREEHIDFLPVVDGNGRLVGVLTVAGILRTYYSHRMERDQGMQPKSRTRAFSGDKKDVPGLHVSNIMERGAFPVARETDTVPAIIDNMIAHNALHLVVMGDASDGVGHDSAGRDGGGRLIGVVTKRDVLEAIVHAQTPRSNIVRYIGLEKINIDSYERLHIQRIAERWAQKIQHYVNNEYEITLHIKEYEKDGSRHKFSVHLRVAYPGMTVPVTEAHAWNARTAVQEGFKRLESELAGKYKTNKKERVSQRKSGGDMPLPGEEQRDAR